MRFSEEQVEWIVVEVLRRLGVAGVEQSSTSADLQNELRMSERVITLRSIEDRLTGVNRLVVQPRAVVTPAARDELKRRNIELIRENRA